MFESIDKSYRQETAELIQLVQAELRPLPLMSIVCYELEKRSPECALRVKVQSYKQYEIISLR